MRARNGPRRTRNLSRRGARRCGSSGRGASLRLPPRAVPATIGYAKPIRGPCPGSTTQTIDLLLANPTLLGNLVHFHSERWCEVHASAPLR